VGAHVLLGRIYLQQNHPDQARVHLKLALDADPQDRDALALEKQLSTAPK
jgi:Tfp pilus assembly protein PilF